MTEDADYVFDRLRGYHKCAEQSRGDSAQAHTNGRAQDAGLGEWDAGDDVEPPPPRGWLLGNVFARTFLSSLIGDGGVGKTAVRYAQLLSLATKRMLTGEHVFQRCRVLIVSLEDDDKELKRRIRAARLYHKVSLDEVRGWLFLAAPGIKAGKLMVQDARGRLALGKLVAHLEEVIIRHKIDIVSLDPFIKSHGVPESDNNAIDRVAQILTDLAQKYDIAIDAPHHARKGTAEPGDADRGRGASAAKDAGRLVYTLTTMSSEEAKTFGIPENKRRLYVRMDSAKVNLVPSTVAKWFKLVGVPLGNGTDLYPNGDEVQATEPWSPPETWADLDNPTLNKILDAIESGAGDGNFYTSGHLGERAAWRVVQNSTGKTDGQSRQIINGWLKSGVLEDFEYSHPRTRKAVKGLRVNAAKRPGTETAA